MNVTGKAVAIKRTAAIAALGLAGFLGVAACGTTSPAVAPAAPQTPPTSASQAPLTAQAGPSPEKIAQDIAGIAVGNGVLTALEGSDGTATSADCDPSTVSNPPDISTPTSASCEITFSDGSIWQQTVTITFDSQGNPIADSTNSGTELSQPASE
jgi:hypothetical protein